MSLVKNIDKSDKRENDLPLADKLPVMPATGSNSSLVAYPTIYVLALYNAALFLTFTGIYRTLIILIA